MAPRCAAPVPLLLAGSKDLYASQALSRSDSVTSRFWTSASISLWMSVLKNAPRDAPSQPIRVELDRLGLELSATHLELNRITHELLRDAREVLAIMQEDIHPQAAVPERGRPAPRSPRSWRGTPAWPRRLGWVRQRRVAMQRVLVIVPIACVGVLAGVAALDTFQNAGSALPKPTGGELTRQREDATLASADRRPASAGAALQPPATRSGGSPGSPADVRAFSWPSVTGAAAYEFILLRGQERVFSRRVLTARLTLPASWHYRGKRRLLRPGVYRWIVLPVRDRAAGPVGKAVVAARLVVD